MSVASVEEIQGLYGPFTVSEKLLQRIWLNKDFHLCDLRTSRGRSLEIVDSGQWNHHEGPDFKDAVLRVDGRDIVGDVEIHFRGQDWFHHGHDTDSNYRNVILHVVLHDDVATAERGMKGPEIESLCLMPLLLRDLEEHAMDDALVGIEQADALGILDELVGMNPSKRKDLLREHAELRWGQKVGFAKRRLSQLGWNEACHQMALEVLGYARNRAPMSRLAAIHPLEEFEQGVEVEKLYQSELKHWKALGARPANHPRNRLQQYASICQQNRDWPTGLLEALESVRTDEQDFENCSDFRRKRCCKRLQEFLHQEVFGGFIGERRVNTMLCDAFFPLWEVDSLGLSKDYWLNWYPGDVPDYLVRFARRSNLFTRDDPMSNGLFQGVLGWLISKDDH